VCLGYPGVLPVLNEKAVELTVMTGLMLGGRINEFSKFDRKSYFYPDMPKNYQISQYDKPFCEDCTVDIEVEGKVETIKVKRIHLEEDVAKNMHFKNSSGIDFNRAGTPLMEIVSEPDIKSPEQAFAYLQALKQMLVYAGVSNCNLEEGNIRCDVNCSVREEGETELGVKTEIKNLNTFKGVLNSLKHEIPRQISVLEAGGEIYQETRRWDVDAGVTLGMRLKEYAHDYRYFPEPDLSPVILSQEQIEQWRKLLPEPPRERKERIINEYGIPEYDAGVLTSDVLLADYFEECACNSDNAKSVSNWIMTEMLRSLSETNTAISDVRISPKELAELINLVEKQTINSTTAKEVFAIMFKEGGSSKAIVEEKGLAQVSDASAIEEFADKALLENPKSVADYKSGKKVALKFLVGQVMRMSKGKANPQMVGALLEEKLRNA
jgi:aspartyl-tRNA(Asn)/glutamyl-tRNA(Gln) amidotransferase subunit B